MASRKALLAGYVYPAVLAVLAFASLLLGFGHRVGFFRPTSRFAVRPLDAEPFYALEVLTFAACAILAYRVVSRLRSGKNVWALRVYWPVVLALFGLFAAALYGLALENRGCGTSIADPTYACWEPRATYLRLALATFATALYLFLLARFASPAPAAAKKPKGPEEAPPPEKVEEIPAR